MTKSLVCAFYSSNVFNDFTASIPLNEDAWRVSMNKTRSSRPFFIGACELSMSFYFGKGFLPLVADSSGSE
jgi:hypothetical protein